MMSLWYGFDIKFIYVIILLYICNYLIIDANKMHASVARCSIVYDLLYNYYLCMFVSTFSANTLIRQFPPPLPSSDYSSPPPDVREQQEQQLLMIVSTFVFEYVDDKKDEEKCSFIIQRRGKWKRRPPRLAAGPPSLSTLSTVRILLIVSAAVLTELLI